MTLNDVRGQDWNAHGPSSRNLRNSLQGRPFGIPDLEDGCAKCKHFGLGRRCCLGKAEAPKLPAADDGVLGAWVGLLGVLGVADLKQSMALGTLGSRAFSQLSNCGDSPVELASWDDVPTVAVAALARFDDCSCR